MTTAAAVAVLGLGAMGLPMAMNLAERFPVRGFDVVAERRALAERAGVVPTGTAAEAVAGADVVVHDPKGLPALPGLHPALRAQPSMLEALEGADLVVLGTEWAELTALDPRVAARRVARRVIIDARNALVPAQWTEAGWDYRGIGRSRSPQRRRTPTTRPCVGTMVG